MTCSRVLVAPAPTAANQERSLKTLITRSLELFQFQVKLALAFMQLVVTLLVGKSQPATPTETVDLLVTVSTVYMCIIRQAGYPLLRDSKVLIFIAPFLFSSYITAMAKRKKQPRAGKTYSNYTAIRPFCMLVSYVFLKQAL